MSAFPQARFLVSAASVGQFPPDQGVEAAFVGRSNAGKSSAINAVAGRKALARTSKTPGRTRLVNFFELAPGLRLVDLPGYGYADVPAHERRDWVPLIDALLERESLGALFLIVDARRGVQDADAQLIDWAHGLEIHVLLAKADKLRQAERIAAERAAAASLSGGVTTVTLFSAMSGLGVEAARDRLEALKAAGKKKPR